MAIAPDAAPSGALADMRRMLKVAFVAVAGFSLIVNLLVLALPLYSLQVFDRVLSSRSLDTLAALTVLTLALLALQAALDHVRGMILRRSALRLEARLSGPTLKASLEEAVRGNPQAAGGLHDLRMIRATMSAPNFSTLFDLPLTPAFVLVVFLIHPALGAFVVGALALLAAMTAAHVIASRGPEDEDARALAAANDQAQDCVRHAEAVTALGMTDSVVRRHTSGNTRVLSLEGHLAARVGAVLATTKFLRMAVQVGITGLGAMLALDGAITPGAMIASTLLMARALAPVEQAVGGWKNWTRARGAAKRLDEALSRPQARVSTQLPAPSGRIAVTNLVVRPPGAEMPVLRGVSMKLEAGHALAIVGRSGAGKSTLVRALAGIATPTSGEIRLDGASLDQWDRARLGSHVGYLPQSVQILAGTVAENISRFATDPSSEAIVAAAMQAGVHELILHLPKGYDTPIGAGGHRLSGGQEQRIGLARALYGDPRVVILDEPNSNLDPEGEAALVEVLGGCRAAGRTVIVVSHRAALLRFVDYILVLRDGLVERAGPRGELMQALAGPADAATRHASPKQRNETAPRAQAGH